MSRIGYSTIAKSGPTNPRNDTASVVELSNGELLVLWHKYEATAAPGRDLAHCRIHAKTSADQALTWGGERMIVDIAPGDLHVPDQCPSWRRIGDIVGGEYELANIGCAFTSAGNAVMTYLQEEDPD